MAVKMIDVSYAQGIIEWDKVIAAGISAVMIRATVSYPHLYSGKQLTGIDTMFKRNVEGALAAGLDVGVYHYSYALSKTEAKLEAQHLLDTIKPYKLTLPVVLDFEDKTQASLSKAEKSAICAVFLKMVQDAGYYAMLYSMASWLEYQLTGSELAQFAKWVAHVGVSKPSYSGSYGIWQYSWTGKVDGISGTVDCNYMYEDYPSIIKAAGLNGWSKQDEPSSPTIETVPKADYDALQTKYDALAAKVAQAMKILG